MVLSRLTFGPRPGDFARVRAMGVDRWLDEQLHPERITDAAADRVLAGLESQQKQAFEIIADHPTPQELQQLVVGRLQPDGTRAVPTRQDSVTYRKAQADAAALTNQILVGRVLHATQSERQLLEVMTDFWENHFSVHIGKMPNRYAVVDYDRTIRAHALGRFRELLGAVAKSPAMLFYLDAWQSAVDSMHPTMPEARIAERRAAKGDSSPLMVPNRRRTGLNENYARELMELHTLGVNGGYTQTDVIEVARCLTGWTIDRPELGGPFLFRQETHDAGPKIVLGVHIPAGRGIEDGEQVLDIVARHPATARFISQKLVVRLLADTAPPSLVERAAQTFLRTDGDIREVVRTIVTSPEFSSASLERAKVKTPFELVVSTLRVLNAPPDTTNRFVGMIGRLGQPIWGRVTPDGWPDRGEAWMNSGALLNRVTFASNIANGLAVALSAWDPAPRLMTSGTDDVVSGVVDAVLAGHASAETRAAMRGALDVPLPDRRTPAQRLSDVLAVALGSPEFQRR